MVDRSFCTLQVYGTLTDAVAGEIAATIVASGYSGADLLAELEQNGSIAFAQVNFGDIDPHTDRLLRAHGLSYVWSNHAGLSYGPRILFYDAATQTEKTYPTIGGEIALTIGDATPDKLAEARRWQAWCAGLIAASNEP